MAVYTRLPATSPTMSAGGALVWACYETRPWGNILPRLGTYLLHLFDPLQLVAAHRDRRVAAVKHDIVGMVDREKQPPHGTDHARLDVHPGDLRPNPIALLKMRRIHESLPCCRCFLERAAGKALPHMRLHCCHNDSSVAPDPVAGRLRMR